MLTLTHCSGFGGGGAIKQFLITLGSNENNVSLSAKLTALGWNGTEPVDVTLTVPSGVMIGAASYALTIPALPTGSPPVKLINAGRIQGYGGSGASGNSGGSGGSGGPALRVQHPTLLTNSGLIAGGGGGGAAFVYNGGGGGGAGIPGGPGGSGYSTSEVSYSGGGNGSAFSGGGGGESSGAGGAPGASGGASYVGGGSPGAWVVGYAFLTIVSNTGTLAGGTA